MHNLRLSLRVLLLAILPVTCYLLPVTNCYAQETLTITTYYPSPSGSYNELGTNKLAVDITGVAVPIEYAAMQNGDVHIGRALIVGAGGVSGFAFDELIGPPDNRPGDGDVLIKGNVGIGTTGPMNKLDVEGATVIGEGYSGTYVAPTNGLLVEGNVGIGLGNPTSNTKLNVLGLVHLSGAEDISWPYGQSLQIGQWDGTTFTERMRIISNGNVGIGTTGPVGRLHIQGADDAADTVVFMPGADTAAAGTPSLNVGIGTTTPGTELHLVGKMNIDEKCLNPPGCTSWAYPSMTFRSAGITGAYSDRYTIEEQTVSHYLAIHPGSSGVGTSSGIVLDSSGNVGIGTASPAATLEVNGDIVVTGNTHSNCALSDTWECAQECPDGQYVAGYTIWTGAESGYECGEGTWSSTRKFKVKCCGL